MSAPLDLDILKIFMAECEVNGFDTANPGLPHEHEGDIALAVGNLLFAVTRWKASAPGTPEGEWDALVQACRELVDAAKPQPKGTADELRAAAKQALETLELYVETYNSHWERGMEILEPDGDAALARLRAALAATKEGS